MFHAKNLIALVALISDVCTASHSVDTKKNLRITERNLYGYKSPYTESVEIKENMDEMKIKSVSNVMHFSAKDYVNSKGSSGTYSSRGSSNVKNYEYSKGSISSSLQGRIKRGNGQMKNKTAATITNRTPRPFKRWNGDGHEPSNNPTHAPVEPVVTPEPTVWSGDAHAPELEPVVTPKPTSEITKITTKKPTAKPTFAPFESALTPEPTVLDPVETLEPTTYYDDIPPTTADAIATPTGQDNADDNMPEFAGKQLRKEVDEQCEQLMTNDVCVERCVVLTSIFSENNLIDESSRVTQSSCLNKRQETKQSQNQ